MSPFDHALFLARRLAPSGWKRTPTVEWQMNGISSREELASFLVFFRDELPGKWEIKLSGGEPFANELFLEAIVPGLSGTAHDVSILTSLSAPRSVLRRFAALLRPQLAVVSTSLPLELADEDAFLTKARELRTWLDPRTVLVVNQVLVPGTLERVRRSRDLVREAGLPWLPRVVKPQQGTAIYSPAEQPLLRELLGHAPGPREAGTAPSYKGARCWAGVEYFVLSPTGDAYACHTAKRSERGYLGNVLEGTFGLERAPAPCPYEICPCAVPASQGMIEAPSLRNRPSV